jgi:hypothetical protein
MANANALRLGRAFVEFAVDSTLLTKGIETARKMLDGLGTFAIKAGGLAGAAGAGLLTPLTAMFTQSAEHARDVGSLANQFGLTTEAISGLGAGFESAGISFENFSGILDSLSGKLLDNDHLLQQFGLNTFALSRGSIIDALSDVADKFRQMTNPMQRAQLASQVFGSEWRKLMPYLEQGAEGIAKLQAMDSVGVIDPERVRRGTAVMQGFSSILAELKYTLLDVGAALLPNVESIKHITGWIKTAGMGVKDWIGANKEAIKVVALVGAGLVVGGTALVTFGSAAIAASALITTMGAIIGGVVTTLTSLPILLGVAGAGFGIYLASQSETGKHAISGLKDTFTTLRDTATDAFDAIGKAISKGDMVTAFRIASTAIQLEFAKMKAKLSEGMFKAATGETAGRTAAGSLTALGLMGNDFDAFLKKHMIGFDKDDVEKERSRK